LRFLLPKRLADSGENLPAAQFRCVLEHRRGGILVQFRAMSEHYQRGIGKIFYVHAQRVSQIAGRPQAGVAIFPKPFDKPGVLSSDCLPN
jgi:hypothetical protein